MKLRPEQAECAATLFELDADEKRLLQEIPYRGLVADRGADRPADLPPL
jgi:hypothetical protein